MKDSLLSSQKDYATRVSYSIATHGDLEYWWNYAIGIKLMTDGIKESGDDRYWHHCFDFPDKNAYIKGLKEQLAAKGGDAFQKIATTKKGEGMSCRIALSNFTFTLLIRAWTNAKFDAALFFNNSYNSIELSVSMTLEELVDWILKKNEEMVDFRREWEEHCLELKKRVMSAELECQALEIGLKDRLKDTDAQIKLESRHKMDGPYMYIECSHPYLELWLPNFYTKPDKLFDFIEDIIRNMPKD